MLLWYRLQTLPLTHHHFRDNGSTQPLLEMSLLLSVGVKGTSSIGRSSKTVQRFFCATTTPAPHGIVRPAMKPISASVKVNTDNLGGETLKELHSKITLDTHFGHHLREIGHQRGNRPKNNHLLNGSRTVTEQRPASAPKAATVMEQRDNRR